MIKLTAYKISYILKSFILIIIAFFIILNYVPFPVYLTNALDKNSINIKEEEYLVKIKDINKKDRVIENIKGRAKAEIVKKEVRNIKSRNSKGSWITIRMTAKELINASVNPEIEKIEKDQRRALQITSPNDTSYSSQWNLNKIGLDNTSGQDGWDLSTGVNGTIVAVVDTGADTNHPDLSGNLWVNSDEIANDGIDNDANGFIDDVNGWNFVCEGEDGDGNCNESGEDPPNNNLTDSHGHGTHVAGTIAAVTNNNKGVSGVCWGCKIMPLKVINADGYGQVFDEASAIYYAVDNGAKVINISLGGGGYVSLEQDAINYAWNNGVTVVVASGNSSDSASDTYPSGLDNVISVGATSDSDIVTSFSNTGYKMDLVAPGLNILATVNCSNTQNSCGSNGKYDYYSGTSMASPHVAGAAALLRDLYPALTVQEVRYSLVKNTENLNTPGFDEYSGFGRLNGHKTLQNQVSYPSDTQSPTGGLSQPTSNNVYNIFQITGEVNDTNLYIYTLNIKDASSYIVKRMSGRMNVASGGVLAEFDTSELDNGEYEISLRIEDFNGNVYITPSKINITINHPKTLTLDGYWMNDSTPTFNWQASTNPPVGTNYDLHIDDTLHTSGINNLNSTIQTNLDEGIYTWFVKEKALNYENKSNTAIFGVDTVMPLSFDIDIVISGSNATFDFDTQDDTSNVTYEYETSGLAFYEISLNGSSFEEIFSPYTKSALQNGTNTVAIRAYDYAGNYRTVSENFTIAVADTTPPNDFEIEVSTFGSNATFTFSTSDSGTGMKNYEVSFNGGTYSNQTSPYTVSLSDGDHIVSVRAFDNAGNSKTSTKSFSIFNRNAYLKKSGDFNTTGKVDLSDLSILAENYGKFTSAGDANSDGRVDLTDLSILAENYGKNF